MINMEMTLQEAYNIVVEDIGAAKEEENRQLAMEAVEDLVIEACAAKGLTRRQTLGILESMTEEQMMNLLEYTKAQRDRAAEIGAKADGKKCPIANGKKYPVEVGAHIRSHHDYGGPAGYKADLMNRKALMGASEAAKRKRQEKGLPVSPSDPKKDARRKAAKAELSRRIATLNAAGV